MPIYAYAQRNKKNVFLGEKRDPSFLRHANSSLRNLTRITQNLSYVYTFFTYMLKEIIALTSDWYWTLIAQISLWLSNRLVNINHLFLPRRNFSSVFRSRQEFGKNQSYIMLEAIPLLILLYLCILLCTICILQTFF